MMPAFAPSSEFRGVPLLGTLIDVIDSIYIPRGGSEENKAKAWLQLTLTKACTYEVGITAIYDMFIGKEIK